MRFYGLLLAWLALPWRSWAQAPDVTYRNPADSTVNYYLTVRPVGLPKGLLVLLPGFGELPEYVYAETDLPKEAVRQGLLTVIVTLQEGWKSFAVDAASQRTLGDLIRTVQERYRLTDRPLYLGGFSLGGSGVVRYAERAVASADLPRPDAVFGIDPPLDFARMYDALLHQRRIGKVPVAVNEAAFLLDRMNHEFGGSPTAQPDQYVALSPYSYRDTTARNATFLRNLPIRLISEPDILWQMNERSRDLYELNAIDCVGLVNYLRSQGNSRAVFVPTVGKGYRRQQNVRNPHSWSIADPRATVGWLLQTTGRPTTGTGQRKHP